jgi:sugar O-acyltransferase (sialic acid O-acetyltransferase NeuD family)
MILYGASGHGKVVASFSTDVQFFFDDNNGIELFAGKKVHLYSSSISKNELIVITIGNNEIRKSIASGITHIFGTAIAPSSEIDASVLIQEGSQILHGAIIQCSATIGKHTIVNTGASVNHDCIIGDFCHIAPQVTLCGNVVVGEGTLVGAGSTVIPGIKIGKWCTVGAGSVILRDIPDHSTVVGNPGRIISQNRP